MDVSFVLAGHAGQSSSLVPYVVMMLLHGKVSGAVAKNLFR